MGFRAPFRPRPHLRERIRNRAALVAINLVGDRARSAEFPRFARELAVRF